MTLKVDLHIHSCLSPCGDSEMTPNNLVNMAWIKGLDAIAVVDHNSAQNLPACAAVAAERGILLVPAIEATAHEDVHVLCYLPTVEMALKMGEWLYARLPDVQNKPALFGEQSVMDAQDQPVATEPRLLIQATTATLAEISAQVIALGGVVVPAHINREASSLLGVLGFFPPDVAFTAVEVAASAPPPRANVDQYVRLHSSDAHQLEDILEPGHALQVAERSVAGILAALRGEHTA